MHFLHFQMEFNPNGPWRLSSRTVPLSSLDAVIRCMVVEEGGVERAALLQQLQHQQQQ